MQSRGVVRTKVENHWHSVLLLYVEELKTSLTGLDVKIKNFEDAMQACRAASKCNQTDSHLKEEIVKEEFEKLHQFLREEEAARLHALMEEEEQKRRKAAERINRLNEVMTSLEDKIRLTERELRAGGEGTEYLQVGETDRWTVGVAAPSALKTATCEASPEAGLWCIRLKDGEYQALTTPTQTLDVSSSRRLNRVRVKLDLEGGTVTFVDADTDAPLFTFTHCFTEAVYPYFEASSAGGGGAVLEQRVKISVESEDRPAKANPPTENGTAAEMARETDAEKKLAESCCAKKEEPGKPEGKEKMPNARNVKKQSRKSRFNVSYHVSLNKALNDAN